VAQSGQAVRGCARTDVGRTRTTPAQTSGPVLGGFLTPDVALIHANGTVLKGARRRNRRNTRVNTSIAVRTDGGWPLAASQNTTHRRLIEKLMGKFVSRMEPSPTAGPAHGENAIPPAR
jgi:hypothetical protein